MRDKQLMKNIKEQTMNEQDKKAFEKWFASLGESHLSRVIKLNRGVSQEAWQAACEYKNKEIDELEKEQVRHIDILKTIENAKAKEKE